MRRDDYRATLHDRLRSGRVFGFFGASDNHERNPGLGGALTGAWATDNTREGVYEAFEQRRVFATTGLRPVLAFRVCGTFMGGAVTTDADPELSVRVVCERPVDRVDIVRDGEVVHTRPGGANRFDDTWTDTACTVGVHFYYAHVTFQGEETVLPWNLSPAVGVHAWSSPVWVTRT